MQAMMASEDKANKALQEGIDAAAEPTALLDELLKRHSSGEDLKEACTSVLKQFPEASAMLDSKQSAPPAAPLLSSFSTPAPKTKLAVAASKLQLETDTQANGGGCDDTIVDDDAKNSNNRAENAEETVMFGAKISATKTAALPPSASDSTPARTPAAPVRPLPATTPKPSAAATATPKPSSLAQSEETVTFGAKITTPGAEGKAAAAGTETAEKKKGALKKGAVRTVKRTGLGGGPARRVNPGDAPAPAGEVADDEKTDAPVTPAAEQQAMKEGGGTRTTPLAYKSSMAGGCMVGAGGGGSEIMMPSTELPPICEQEGRVSGEGASNTSTSSSGR